MTPHGEAAGTLSLGLAGIIADIRPGSLSPAASLAARRVLLDAVGVMLGASGLSPEAAMFACVAQGMGAGPSTILGTGATASPAMAALANGALAHALDYEDSFDIAPGHPNASLVPALLALAQARGPVSGERLIAALAAGCEVSCRMALALRRPMEEGGWYPPPIVAGFGAAAGAAHLLGLPAQGIVDAMSLALCQVTMPGEIKHSQGTVIRAVREAFPAQAGVLAALLAEQGVAGFEQPLEGKGGFFALYAGGQFAPEVLLAPAGGGLWIEQLTFKPWPSCRGTHPYIQMALALRQQHGLSAADVAQVRVGVGPMQRMLVEPPFRKRAPATAIDAKFSIPFCVATALGKGAVGLDSFGAGALADPQVLALAATVEAHQPAGAEGWRGDAGTLEILLSDGRGLSAALDRSRGTPDDPIEEAELIHKFVDCAGRAANPVPSDAARALADRILSVDNCDDAGSLFAI